MTYKLALGVLISSISLSYYFINIAGIPKKIKGILKYPFHKRIRPLDCLTCLSVWSAAIIYFLPHEIIFFIGVIFLTGIFANYINTSNENIG